MRKRIGTNIYDTDKSILILEPDLYRKKNSFVFFRCDGKTITPMTNDEAESLIKESGNQDAEKYLTYHDDTGRNLGSVRIDLQYIQQLSLYCKKHNLTQKEVVESLIASLPD